MLRRLHHEQPEGFAFTPANQAWAEAQITKYPEGRQASAIIPLLWRAQEQEGWLTRPAIEHIAAMLDLAYIRALEVATFYFMFQLQPVGSVAHIQICGTTSCMICGAEDLMQVCKDKIAAKPHALSADGRFSWEEVECLGACANAPMAQIGKDYYEDLTEARLAEIIDELAEGKVPVPGPQNGRYSSEPLAGLVTLTEYDSGQTQYNASVQRAVDVGDTVKRIDGTEVPLLTPWKQDGAKKAKKADVAAKDKPAKEPRPSKGKPADATGVTEQEAQAVETGRPRGKSEPAGASAAAETAAPAGTEPALLSEPRGGTADDLKLIKGIGPKLEGMLHAVGIYHYDQIANWTPEELEWADTKFVGFKGRVTRDGWIEQARKLAAGEETEFATRAKKDGIYDDD
ncbi:NADH-quinone oxidoreductase subunit E [Pseudooceanicola sp. LIPI14-2-Ac024]|uniref:NADH-quinone oxidoreductase subunit E n=1 Tax=Pseudooceanicola sp. LIPI14-2-Ac024 TaxID=3344875 RepID=UPI0035CEB744